LKINFFSVTTKPPPIPTPTSSNKVPKPLPMPTLPSNSTTNPVLITTQFPSIKTRAASEPKDSTTNFKPPPSPPVPIKRLTPTPPPVQPPIVNGYKKKTTPPGTFTQQERPPSPDKTKPIINKPLLSSIFVPPPTIPNASNVRIDANIEIGRLEMEDLAQKELNNIYESYINDLIEEVIQSDFEKPSIPEVILAVITDLTNDDDGNDHPQQQKPLNNLNQIYNFNQDKIRSSSPNTFNNTNGINGDIDHYYTRVHQKVANVNGLNNHDSMRSTNSSNKSIGLTSAVDPSSNPLQVKIFFSLKFCVFFVIKNKKNIVFFRLEQHVVVLFEQHEDLLDQMVKKKKLLLLKLLNHIMTINHDYLNGKSFT